MQIIIVIACFIVGIILIVGGKGTAFDRIKSNLRLSDCRLQSECRTDMDILGKKH